MKRSVLAVVAALVMLMLSACGGGSDAPTVSNEAPFVGEKFTLSGTVDADGARSVVLEEYDDGEGWDEVAKAESESNGEYAFTTSQDDPVIRYRVVAAAAGELEKHVTAPVKVTTVEDEVHLSVVRAGTSGTAIGESRYRKAGRNFELQWLDGSDWKKLGSAAEDDHGRVSIPFDVKGSRFYRLVGDVIAGTKGATSPATRFTKGPEKLSQNVMYVTVDDFKDPVVKGTNYEANAVMVTDGQATKPFRVDEFAVRGNSSASKVKHPYKIKFKKARRPFNLPEDKTWILLANYGDRSLVRTALGYTMGAGLDGLKWTPTPHVHRAVRQRRLQGQLSALGVDQDRQEPHQHRPEEGRRRRGRQALQGGRRPRLLRRPQAPVRHEGPRRAQEGQGSRRGHHR